MTPKELGIVAGLAGSQSSDNPITNDIRLFPHELEREREKWESGRIIGEKLLALLDES